MRHTVGPCLTLAIAAHAAAQSAILIDIEHDRLLPGQSTTVTLSAAWPPHEFAMAYLWTNVETSVGSTGWSGHELITPMDGPGTSPGSATAVGIEGITAGQLNYCPTIPYCPFRGNPAPFWRATYTAPTDVGAAFDVDLLTRTTRFEVYFADRVVETHSYLHELVEGQATIHVIPAPASTLALAMGLSLRRRRR